MGRRGCAVSAAAKGCEDGEKRRRDEKRCHSRSTHQRTVARHKRSVNRDVRVAFWKMEELFSLAIHVRLC